MIFTVQPSDECDGPPPSWSGEVWGGGEEEGVIFRVATCSCVSVCQCDVECVCVCVCVTAARPPSWHSAILLCMLKFGDTTERKRGNECARGCFLCFSDFDGVEAAEESAVRYVHSVFLTCVSDGWDQIQAHFCTSVLSLPASLSSWFFHLWAKWCFEVC